jgi:hypothetical protein
MGLLTWRMESKRMHYLLGTDEAGYGPNLGPLVIAASLWRVDDADLAEEVNLYERLAHGVTAERSGAQQRIAIADSKQLYSAGDSCEALERGVLSALSVLQRPRANCRELATSTQAVWDTSLAWQAEFNPTLPLAWRAEEDTDTEELWQTSLRKGKVQLIDYRAKLMQPAEFNAGCTRWNSKGAVLSTATLNLAREMIAAHVQGPLRIVCDKHGGRNTYAGLLFETLLSGQDQSPFALQTVCESRAESVYRWSDAHQPREIRFVAKGERFLPAALASMLAKYWREVSMQAWNEYWQQQVPGIQPTAGYPQDAKRFRLAMESTAAELELDPQSWWRDR